MNLLRYHKLDLPQFEYGEVIWSKPELVDACAKPEVTDVVRYIKFAHGCDIPGLGLATILTEASASFDKNMRAVGGFVVPHIFGLARTPRFRGREREASCQGWNKGIRVIPKNFELVAQVAVLKSVKAVDHTDTDLVKAVYPTVQDFWTWQDYDDPEQYVWAMNPNSGQVELALVDIEPLFYDFNPAAYYAHVAARGRTSSQVQIR